MKLLVTCLLILFANNSYSQTVYSDAVRLRKYIVNNNFENGARTSIDTILSHYLSDPDATISSTFGSNPFIKDFFSDRTPHNGFPGLLSSVKSSVSNLDVTNIADGLARFLIKRGREELNIAFFNQLKQFLNDPKNEECKVLFPETIDLLDKIDSYKYAAFLENLRNAFHTDLSNLIIHLNQAVDLPKYDTLVHHDEIKLVLGTANIVSELSQSGNSIMPDSVIHQLALLPWGAVSKNLENALKFLNLISQSIRADRSLHQSWVSLSDLNTNLLRDSITLRIYFGLLYEQVNSQNITFYGKDKKDSIRVDILFQREKNHIFRLSGLIENFSLLADDVQNSISNYSAKKEKGALSDADNYTYISKAINIINYGFTVAKNFRVPDDIKVGIMQDKYIEVARNANELYKNIYTKIITARY
jgi:hypothetical protein